MAAPDNWDDHWDRYGEAAELNPAQSMRHHLLLKLLVQAGAGVGIARILDFGSGQGDFLALARREFPAAELAGFEMSPRGIARSREKVPGARFTVADLFSPPPECGEYRSWASFGICSEVLEHVDDPAGLVRAACSYLAPAATLLVTVPSGPMSAFDRHIGHRRHFDRQSIASVLRTGGLAVERVFRAGFPFFNVYRLLVVARGRQLIGDIVANDRRRTSQSAKMAMALFRTLFRINLSDAPGGWQLIAVARNTGVTPQRGDC